MVPSVAEAALPVPRYHQIYLVLRDQLRDGRFPPNVALPGELELASQFGVSRVTMRAALDRLVDEDLIERHRGRGTFARPAAPHVPRAALSGLLENLVALGLRTSVRVIDLKMITAPPDVVAGLRLKPGELVQKAIRLRAYKGAPMSHITTYVPERFAATLSRRELTATPMLALLEHAGVKVASADQSMSARLADAIVAPLLEVDLGAPLIAVTRVVTDTNGVPVQLLRGLYRPDRYEYRMHLSRAGHDEGRIWVTEKASA